MSFEKLPETRPFPTYKPKKDDLEAWLTDWMRHQEKAYSDIVARLNNHEDRIKTLEP